MPTAHHKTSRKPVLPHSAAQAHPEPTRGNVGCLLNHDVACVRQMRVGSPLLSKFRNSHRGQAYRPEIFAAVPGAGTFPPPFGGQRMACLNPSFDWMMYRCGFGAKAGQEIVLGIDLARAEFEWCKRFASSADRLGRFLDRRLSCLFALGRTKIVPRNRTSSHELSACTFVASVGLDPSCGGCERC